MKTFKVTAQRNGTRVPFEVGEAIENRDGSIALRLRSLDLPFDGRLKLHPEAEEVAGETVLGFKVKEPQPPRVDRIAVATIGPPPPGAVEAYNRGNAERVPYLAIRCSCKGSKPNHEPIGDFGLLCSVPADSVKR